MEQRQGDTQDKSKMQTLFHLSRHVTWQSNVGLAEADVTVHYKE